MTEIVGAAEFLLSLNTKELEANLKKTTVTVKKELEDIGDAGEKTLGEKSVFSKIGDTLISAGTAKAFDVITNSASSFASNIMAVGSSFESIMAQVSAISGASGDSLEELSVKARELGANTKYSASEVGEGFTYMAMAGWETEDMLSGIDGMLALATAGCTDLGIASDIVTDNLTAFGMSAKDTNRMVDAMAATVTGSNTTVSMMGETLKYVGSTAGALGYSFEDCAVAIGLMANAGIKGSQAGTSLRSIMNRLANDTSGAATAIADMGIETVNADGSMRDFSDVMTDMRGVFANLSEAEKAQLASTIAGTEGMSGLLAIVNASDEDYEKLTDSINNSAGAAQEMADIMGDTTEGKVKGLQSKIEELQTKAFDTLKPAIDFVIEALGFFVDHMEITIPVLGALATAFAVVKIGGFVSSLKSIVSLITQGVIPAIRAFGSVMLANPAILAIGAIIAAIALLIANFDKVKEVVMVVFTFVGTFIDSVVEGISQAFQSAWDFITGLFGGIGQFFSDVFGAAFDAIKDVFEGIAGFFQGVWDTIIGIFTGIGAIIGNAVSGAFKTVVNGVLSFIEGFINTPIGIINSFIDVINGVFGVVGVNLGHLSGVSLPRMYTGGIVPATDGGMPILAGDGNEDEWVVPESKMASLVEQLSDRANLSGPVFNFTFEGVLGTPEEMRKLAVTFHDKYQEVEKARFTR